MDNPGRAGLSARMNPDADILIVGGGLTGPALALALADGGFSVTVIDSRPAESRAGAGFDGRAYALALASRRLLGAIGVWSAVAGESQPIFGIRITDGRAGDGPGPWMLNFDHAEIEEGPMGHMLEDRFLYAAFLKAMREHPRIDHLSGVAVCSQDTEDSFVRISLEDGQILTGGVLVGCDGRESGTARRAGIERTGWGYGQTALVCALNHELPHRGVAHQYFMPPGPLAILPLPDDRVSVVWSESRKAARDIQALDDADYLAVLRPRFGDFLGRISLAGERFAYPLSLSLANRLAAGRTALVGDAAHGVHPLAGQGLNLGLRDAGALAEVLIRASRRGEDPGAADVLARYERWRRWDTVTLALAMDGFNRLFSNDNGLLRLARGVGLGIVNATPRLRRAFIREAVGLTGDLPILMRGQQV